MKYRMRNYITLLACLLTLSVAQAQDSIIRRNTTTSTTSTTKPSSGNKHSRPRPKPKPEPANPIGEVIYETFTANGISFKMIRVEGSSFTMGTTSDLGSKAEDDEKPAHKVTLSTYYIGETEVTQALWEAVMGSNPSHRKGSSLPVENVSWEDCQNFVRELNRMTGKSFRLPTEAEWEYAARGGNKSLGYYFSGSNNINKVAWYTSNSGDETHPVKSKSPNELGLYDMTGNVFEWCQDWYGTYSSFPQTDPKGANTGSERVYRGGAWFFSAWVCRVLRRSQDRPDLGNDDIGLRLAL